MTLAVFKLFFLDEQNSLGGEAVLLDVVVRTNFESPKFKCFHSTLQEQVMTQMVDLDKFVQQISAKPQREQVLFIHRRLHRL